MSRPDVRFPLAPVFLVLIATMAVGVSLALGIDQRSVGARPDTAGPLAAPDLLAATYLGGAHRFGDLIHDVAVDSAGAIYVTGETYGDGFPVVDAAQARMAGESDAFVTKLAADGRSIVYSTYLGGAERDVGYAIAVDAGGRAVVAGHTLSSDFPTVGAMQGEHGGGNWDAFVAVLSSSGAVLEHATYLGGRNDDQTFGLALDADGAAVVVGQTASRDFPRVEALQGTLAGPLDGFVTRLDLGTGEASWSTYLGGSDWEAIEGVAVAPDGVVHLGGSSASADFPAAQGAGGPPAHHGGDDGFLARLSADGATLLAATFAGGTGDENGWDLAIDDAGRTILVGLTESTDLPTTAGTQSRLGGGTDGFVARLNAAGDALDLLGYVGGPENDELQGVTIDAAGGLLVSGLRIDGTWPPEATTHGPVDGYDALLARLTPQNGELDWISYLGGSTGDGFKDLALDPAGNVVVAGFTSSDDWPASPDAPQTEFGGGSFDGIVARLGDPEAVLATATPGGASEAAIRMAFARASGADDLGHERQHHGPHQDGARGRFDVFVANRFGVGATVLVGGPDDEWQPVWSPDCRKILFSRGRRELPATPTATRVIDPTAPPPTPTPTFIPQAARPAADRNAPADRMAVSSPAQVEEPFDLWTVDADGSALTRLTTTAWSELDAAWSPDGARIAYAADRGGPWDLWIAEADGTNPRQLTTTPLEDRDPAWSPDGMRIAYTCNVARQLELCVIDAAGGDPTVLLTAPGTHESAPAWSPDGTTIAFVRESFADRRGDIWAVAADGSNARAVATGPGDERDPAWAPDGALLFDTDGQPRAEAPPGPTEAAEAPVAPEGLAVPAAHAGLAPTGLAVPAAHLAQNGRRAIWELPDWLAGNDAVRRVEGRQAALCREPRGPTPAASASATFTVTPGPSIPVTPSPTLAPTPTAATPAASPTATGTPFPPGTTGIVGQFMAVPTVRMTMRPIPILPDDALMLVAVDGLQSVPQREGRLTRDGRFHFEDLPPLPRSSHWAVRFVNQGGASPPGIGPLLMRWQSAPLDLAPDALIDLGHIDLSEPRLEATPGVVQRGMPIELRYEPWTRGSSDAMVVLRDPESGEPVFSSEPFPAGRGFYRFEALPRVLSPGETYSWEIVVVAAAVPTGDGGPGQGFPTNVPGGAGVGLSANRGLVALEPGPTAPRPTIRPIPILPPTARRTPPAPGGAPPASHPAASGAGVAAQSVPAAPLGLPLAMNQHTPGVLVELLRQAGAVVGGQYASRPAPIAGPGATGIQVQNLATDGEPAAITAAFYEQYDPYDPGQLFSQQPAAAHLERRSAAPGAAANIYLPTSDLPFPTSYSALIDGAGASLAAIYRADWPSTGGAAIYSNVAPSDELVVPLVLRNFAGQNSVVTVQNLSPPESDARLLANVRLRIYAAGSTAVASERHIALRKGQSVTVDLGSVHPAFTQLGEDFVGSMRIVADSLIGAQALIGAGARSVSGFEGVPLDAAATELYVPLFRAGQPGLRPGDRLDTGISVVNPGDEEVEVTVDFRPTTAEDPRLAACQAAAPRYLQRATIPAGSSHVFYQGAGGRIDMAPAMPEPCFGSATIRATGGVLAIVQDGQNGTELLAAYNAVPRDQAAEHVAVPLFRNDHSAYHLTTGIQVMNVSDETALGARITFRSTDPDGGSSEIPCGAACVVDIPAGGSHTFWPGDPALSIPPGTFGAAVVESPQPVAVIVNDYPLTGAVDAATYNAIPMR